jgi:predicted Zn-dependent protease
LIIMAAGAGAILPAHLPASASPASRLTVRVVDESSERLLVRRSIACPIETSADRGAMVTAWRRQGVGYCATADLSADGLQRAADEAGHWAAIAEQCGVFQGVDLHALLDARALPDSRSPIGQALPPRAALLAMLREESDAMHPDRRIVSWSARLSVTRREQWLYVDGQLRSRQSSQFVEPNLEVTAADGGLSQTRTLAGQYNGFCQQGGLEVIRASGLFGGGARIAREALQLLVAPDCPSGPRDLLLMPDQMMLQIHESIGHPLELDRILGDERNFAGGSFVDLDMFGHYQYGSPLLDVSFDPDIEHELAAYRCDDDGEAARKVWLIKGGILQRPLGGGLSRARAQARGVMLEGTANARAVGWHRPPIDRMANLNIEPGETSLADMIASVERGVLMRTNVSWSIDDARNKFQFGCEWGQLIEEGRLTTVVRNPGYRGISATFWRSLSAVGDRATVEVLGTPFCGKGEPGQVIRVGHASPACLFRQVDVFGGQG